MYEQVVLTQEQKDVIRNAKPNGSMVRLPNPSDSFVRVPDGMLAELLANDIERFAEIVSIAPFALRNLARQYGIDRYEDYVLANLFADWTEAVMCGNVWYVPGEEDKIFFPIHECTIDGAAIQVGLKKCDDSGSRPWYLYFAPNLTKVKLMRYQQAGGPEPEAVEASDPTSILTPHEREIIERAAASAYYLASPVPAEIMSQLAGDFDGIVAIPPTSLARLKALYADERNVRDLIRADWALAFDCGAIMLKTRGTLNFAIHVARADGVALRVAISPNRKPGNAAPWFLSYVPDASILTLERDVEGVVPGASVAPQPAPTPVPQPQPDQQPQPAPAAQPASAAQPQLQSQPAPQWQPAPAPAISLPPRADQALLGMLGTQDYWSSPLPPDLREELAAFDEPLSAHTGINKKVCDILIGDSNGALADDVAARALIDRDWQFAFENGIVRYFVDKRNESKKKIIFPISILRNDGKTPIELAFWRNTSALRTMPWYLFGVYDEVVGATRSLLDWAWLGQGDAFYAKLAQAALPERWSFRDAVDGAAPDYGILKSYINYTFLHLCRQVPCGVLENEERGLAAFNTGLVDRVYRPLYAVFEKNTAPGRQPWFFKDFCYRGESGYGAKLSSCFDPLPPRATYFTRKEDLIFDATRPLDPDYDHILLDNIDRLPREFLRREIIYSPGAEVMLAKLDEAFDAQDGLVHALEPDEHRARKAACDERFDELRVLVEADYGLHQRLISRLTSAIDLARKRAEWSFRTAVPSYYPTSGRMSLLLPLDLTYDEQADVALVVELEESGRYIAKTILTMQMAYNDARLICRPESDWLNASAPFAPSDLDALGEDPKEETGRDD